MIGNYLGGAMVIFRVGKIIYFRDQYLGGVVDYFLFVGKTVIHMGAGNLF